MKLFYYKDPNGLRNFGDDMNPWFWEKFLPNGFNEQKESILVGIGTLLNDLHRELRDTPNIAVFGSGVGYGKQPPAVNEDWTIYCVRGPLSAKALGIDKNLAVTDPATLVNQFVSVPAIKRYKFSYVPHAIHANDAIRKICEDSDIHYIDPRNPIQEVFQEIADTKILLTEAMHGAIVGNSLRVPWVPVVTANIINAFKWRDWCASVGLEYTPNPMMPVWSCATEANALAKLRNSTRLALARRQLVKICRTAKPQLSSDERLKTLTHQLLDKMDILRTDIQRNKYL